MEECGDYTNVSLWLKTIKMTSLSFVLPIRFLLISFSFSYSFFVCSFAFYLFHLASVVFVICFVICSVLIILIYQFSHSCYTASSHHRSLFSSFSCLYIDRHSLFNEHFYHIIRYSLPFRLWAPSFHPTNSHSFPCISWHWHDFIFFFVPVSWFFHVHRWKQFPLLPLDPAWFDMIWFVHHSIAFCHTNSRSLFTLWWFVSLY